MKKEQFKNLVYAMQNLVNSNPGLSFFDYCDRKLYNNDRAKVARQRLEALRLLQMLLDFVDKKRIEEVEDNILYNAYDRVDIINSDTGFKVKYIAGQYYPMEYRPAVSYWAYRVLISLAMKLADGNYKEAQKLLLNTFYNDKRLLKSYFN
jgi:hypothetical protein